MAKLAWPSAGKDTMKLSLEEKVKYVLQYNRGGVIKTPDDAKKRSSFMSSLREWAKRYNEEGANGLKRKKNKTCTEEEKKAIANWCRKYSNPDQNQVECNTKEDTDMPEKKNTEPIETAEQKSKHLEAENEQLRAEIAILKNQ